jgi:hypothetical protein
MMLTRGVGCTGYAERELGWGLSIVGNPAVGSGCGVEAAKEQVREAEFVMVLKASEGARVL